MILGIGNDLVDIRRIEALLEKFPARFERKIFSPRERTHAIRSKNPRAVAGAYAKRFAAKEAFAKALGSGVNGLSWQEIEVVNLPSGQPVLNLSGQAAAMLRAKTPRGMEATAHLSLSDEYPYAQAFVVIAFTPLP